MRIFLGISGASATHLGLKLANLLQEKCELYCVLSKGAKLSFCLENEGYKHLASKGWDDFLAAICKGYLLKKNIFLSDANLGASPASGSFKIDKTIIAPCSLNTLGKIASCISDTLITRACAVAMKENKKLILAPRESPLSTIVLGKMYELSKQGVIIAPPMIAGYSGQSLAAKEANIIGKWMDLLGFDHDGFVRWEGV